MSDGIQDSGFGIQGEDDRASPIEGIPLFVMLAVLILWLLSGCAAPLPAGPLPARHAGLADAITIAADFDTRLSRPELTDDLEEERGQGLGVGGQEKSARPLVFVYTAGRCEACRRCWKETRDDRDFRWEFLEEERWPEWAEAKPKPLLHWQGATGWLSRSGWISLDDFRATWQRSQDRASPNPESRIPNPVREWHARYGQVPSGWTWPGDLRSHLRNEHGISESRLRSMTAAQAARLHDALHERRRVALCPTCP